MEFLFPYSVPIPELTERVERHGLEVALFNCPAGNWERGERGIAALPDRVAECRRSVELALQYARALSCRRLHLMAGVRPPQADRELHVRTFVENLRYTADAVAPDGIDVMVEPLNTKIDIPGYRVESTSRALDLVRITDRPNVKLQYDIHHMQIMEGALARTLDRLLPVIGHVQLADNPGRGESGAGEIDYPSLLAHVDAQGYRDCVGCEYRPRADTIAGLGRAAPDLRR